MPVQVKVKIDCCESVRLVVCEPVTPSTGLMVRGLKPEGPVMVHAAGALTTFQVKVTGVDVFLRTRRGDVLKVMIGTSTLTQEEPLVLPAEAVQVRL